MSVAGFFLIYALAATLYAEPFATQDACRAAAQRFIEATPGGPVVSCLPIILPGLGA
jgi:hypothetical protein